MNDPKTNGSQCSACDRTFVAAHGYPVLCVYCFSYSFDHGHVRSVLPMNHEPRGKDEP